MKVRSWRGFERPTTAWSPTKARPRRKPGQNATGSKRPRSRSAKPSSPVPEFSSQSSPAVEARRVRHREVREHALAARDVDQAAALVAAVAPAGGHVRAAHGRDEGRTPAGHREAVQVAAILGREARDERRLPERREAVALRERREAAVRGVDEDDAAALVDRDVVDVEVAGGVRLARHVEAVEAVVQLARRERVVELPELPARAQQQPVRRGVQAHRPVEVALEDREPAALLHADQEQAVRLIGREREARAGLGEPGQEVPRDADLEGRGLRCHRAGSGAGRARRSSQTIRAARAGRMIQPAGRMLQPAGRMLQPLGGRVDRGSWQRTRPSSRAG